MTLLTRRLFIVILALLAFAPLSAKAAQQEPARSSSAQVSPVELINGLYKVHRVGQGPFFNRKGKKYLPRFFDPTLAALIWKNIVETPSGEIGRLDFTPQYTLLAGLVVVGAIVARGRWGTTQISKPLPKKEAERFIRRHGGKP